MELAGLVLEVLDLVVALLDLRLAEELHMQVFQVLFPMKLVAEVDLQVVEQRPNFLLRNGLYRKMVLKKEIIMFEYDITGDN